MSNIPRSATQGRRTQFRLCVSISFAAALGIATGALAQTWNETGDAGELPGTAQTTTGLGSLATINGTLASASDVDMYCITIQDDPSFLARLICVAIQGPNLWLFDAAGKGVAANSFCVGGDKRIMSTFVFSPGKYYIAVSFNGVNPFSGADAIWLPANTGERAPDGPGAAGAVTSWQGTGQVQPLNPYEIRLSSVGYCDLPVPTDAPTWGNLKVIYR